MQPYRTNGSLPECPISKMLNIISAKWTVEILREASIEPVRTRRFLRLIPSLSMKCLQERLKELEHYGLIKREEFDELPRRVEHSITERGQRILKIMVELKEIAAEVMEVDCTCPFEGANEHGPEDNCPRRPPLRSGRK
ncbi:MAG TPA: helix-turn-helix domain-containing protein [Candidatus Obscuribacterales bacterium]